MQQFVEDLSIFFEPGTPGIMPAVWNGTKTVYCDFVDPYTASLGGVADGRNPVSTCDAGQVPGIKAGDSWLVNGTPYKVCGVQPDGTGIMLLQLEKQ